MLASSGNSGNWLAVAWRNGNAMAAMAGVFGAMASMDALQRNGQWRSSKRHQYGVSALA